eukprot:SAG11_NODE_3011_length_2766_cov_2.386577_4_plen_43_part_00
MGDRQLVLVLVLAAPHPLLPVLVLLPLLPRLRKQTENSVCCR